MAALRGFSIQIPAGQTQIQEIRGIQQGGVDPGAFAGDGGAAAMWNSIGKDAQGAIQAVGGKVLEEIEKSTPEYKAKQALAQQKEALEMDLLRSKADHYRKGGALSNMLAPEEDPLPLDSGEVPPQIKNEDDGGYVSEEPSLQGDGDFNQKMQKDFWKNPDYQTPNQPLEQGSSARGPQTPDEIANEKFVSASAQLNENIRSMRESGALQGMDQRALASRSAGPMSPAAQKALVQQAVALKVYNPNFTPSQQLAAIEKARGENEPEAFDTKSGFIEINNDLANEYGVPKRAPNPVAGFDQKGARQLLLQKDSAITKALAKMDDKNSKIQEISDKLNRFSELNNNTTTGPITGGLLGFARPFLNRDFQEMQSLQYAVAPKMKEAGAGSNSDRDVKMFLASTVGVDKDPETNQNIAMAAAAIAEDQRLKKDFMDNYKSAHKTLQKAEEYWQQYKRENPVFANEPGKDFILNTNRLTPQEYFTALNNGEDVAALKAARQEKAPQPEAKEESSFFPRSPKNIGVKKNAAPQDGNGTPAPAQNQWPTVLTNEQLTELPSTVQFFKGSDGRLYSNPNYSK